MCVQVDADAQGTATEWASSGQLPSSLLKMAVEDHLNLPRPGLLTVIVCYTAVDASAWMDHFALRFAEQDQQRFIYFTRILPSRRQALAERRAWSSQVDLKKALAWVDERFNFQPSIDDPMLRNIDIADFDGVVIDPFDPKLAWEQGRQNEFAYLSEVMAAVHSFAAGHQIHLWLVAPPAPRLDFRPPEDVRDQLMEEAKEHAVVNMVDGSTAAQLLARATQIPRPNIPIWAGGTTVFRAVTGPQPHTHIS